MVKITLAKCVRKDYNSYHYKDLKTYLLNSTCVIIILWFSHSTTNILENGVFIFVQYIIFEYGQEPRKYADMSF